MRESEGETESEIDRERGEIEGKRENVFEIKEEKQKVIEERESVWLGETT